MTLIFKKLNEISIALAQVDHWVGDQYFDKRKKYLNEALKDAEEAADWVKSLSLSRVHRKVENHMVDFEVLRYQMDSYWEYRDESFFNEIDIKKAISW